MITAVEIVAENIMISMGIVPMTYGSNQNMSEIFAQISENDAEIMRRKFRKAWRKIAAKQKNKRRRNASSPGHAKHPKAKHVKERQYIIQRDVMSKAFKICKNSL